ncbi:hypothetical protein EJ110_NYTH41134 [Nymphaea thermarum]|nr:hypothetical protein EJ110_NYTH41134 [Nymphaea thermarum]
MESHRTCSFQPLDIIVGAAIGLTVSCSDLVLAILPLGVHAIQQKSGADTRLRCKAAILGIFLFKMLSTHIPISRWPSCQIVAIKRATQGSMQGGVEFKTEIQPLSRVHHKNLVAPVGFCVDRH